MNNAGQSDTTEKGDYDKAIRACNKAIKLDTECAAAYNQRGLLYKTKSRTHLQRVDVYADKYGKHRAFEEFRRFYGAYRRAIDDFSTAIALEPHNAAFYKNRGETHNEAMFGQSEDAIKDYTKAISLDPNDADTYIKCGETYANRKEYTEAREAYNQAIRVDPNNPKAWYKRGCIQSADLKIRDLSKAIELDPSYVDAYNERANEYSLRGSYFQDENDDFQADRYSDLSMEDHFRVIRIKTAKADAKGAAQ
jgi:tetratricopeptide (TPR) repeat protein